MESSSTPAVDAAAAVGWPPEAGGVSEVALSATIVAGLLDAAPDGLLMVDPDGRLDGEQPDRGTVRLPAQ